MGLTCFRTLHVIVTLRLCEFWRSCQDHVAFAREGRHTTNLALGVEAFLARQLMRHTIRHCCQWFCDYGLHALHKSGLMHASVCLQERSFPKRYAQDMAWQWGPLCLVCADPDVDLCHHCIPHQQSPGLLAGSGTHSKKTTSGDCTLCHLVHCDHMGTQHTATMGMLSLFRARVLKTDDTQGGHQPGSYV